MPVRMPVNYSDIITIYQSINSDFAKISAGKNAMLKFYQIIMKMMLLFSMLVYE
jgi:hypothetical protein